ncbi:hypothetical protein RJT34_30041 [Clitoria ternatea]|uniref:Uncharacterized protein n=1 Tax=Clitoria ternatea TaxID=43366 RepID=A0AAN9ESL3_CLITE
MLTSPTFKFLLLLCSESHFALVVGSFFVLTSCFWCLVKNVFWCDWGLSVELAQEESGHCCITLSQDAFAFSLTDA